jgi:hypothetical protein
VQSCLDSVDRKILEDAYLGLYITNDFNAWAGRDPESQRRVVVLHEGLPHTLIAWANNYVKYIETGGGTDVQSLSLFPPVVRYIVSIWNNVGLQHPRHEPALEENSTLADELYFASLCFIVAHEIGHIRFGHEEYTSDEKANHEMEFEADLHGLEATTRFALVRASLYSDTWVFKFALMAPLFVMSLLCLLGDNDSETHPSAGRRLEALIARQEEVFRAILGGHASAALTFHEANLFEILAVNARNLFKIVVSLMDGVDVAAPGSGTQLPATFVRV